jgi:hypothetical protein
VENISNIQQLLAESKFVEAQKAAELILNQSKGSETIELLELYFDSLKAQSRPLPYEQLFLLIDKLLPLKAEEAQVWLTHISKDHFKDKQRIIMIEIRIAELKGKTEELYRLISQYQILRYEAHIPNLPDLIQTLTKKYFPHDFHLQLQNFALELMRMDLVTCEKAIKELILSCYEKSSPKGTKLKLNLLYAVLKSTSGLHHLELYKNFCFFMANGKVEKKDYKKIIELVIYFEDFKFQVLILNLLIQEELEDVAKDYAQEIRTNKDYNYVYLDKFLPHLKSLFFQKPEVAIKRNAPLLNEMDLKVEKAPIYPFYDEILSDVSEEEILLAHLLKHQDFSTIELLEIAVSFVQSEFYLAALKASDLAFTSTNINELKLKACYLKVTCLLQTGDFRAALDLSLMALNISVTQNDILSFLYSQAEAHLKLKEYQMAKKVLRKILTIDDSYRMAKDRLERLNAI